MKKITKSITINIAKDFSSCPNGITLDDGPHSGETFDIFLIDKYVDDNIDEIIIELDGTMGYSSAWLKAAFGYLYVDQKIEKLKLISKDSSLVLEISDYLNGNL